MPLQEIDCVPMWYEEHGDPAGPPLVALHGGILTFHRSFDDVLGLLRNGTANVAIAKKGEQGADWCGAFEEP